MFPFRGYKNNNSMTFPPRPILRGRSLQIYEEITNTMYNERRLELLEGGGPSFESVLCLRLSGSSTSS